MAEQTSASTQPPTLPQSASETSHPVSMMPLPGDLQRALTALVSHLTSTSLSNVKTAYDSASWACRGPQRFALCRATVDRYLELTAALYEEHSESIEIFTPNFCAYRRSADGRNALLTNMMTCGAEQFARLLQNCLRRKDDVQYALRAALREGRVLYFKWFCTVACNFPDLAQIVVDVVWNVRHNQLYALPDQCLCSTLLPSEMAWRYLTKTLSETASWMEPDPDYDTSPLVTWMNWNFKGFSYLDVGLCLTPRQRELLPDFVNFCMQRRASVVAIFMATMVKDWPLVLAVLGRRPEELRDQPIFPSKLMFFIRNKAPLDIVTETVLAIIDRSTVSTLKFQSSAWLSSDLDAMSKVCLAGDRRKWAIFFLIHAGNWEEVWAQLAYGRERDVVDLTILNAARYSQWCMVEVMFDFSPGDDSFLFYVFQRAAADCEVNLVKHLLPRVDLALLPFVQGAEEGPTAIFKTLVDFTPGTDRISRAKIVLMLVRQGLASHCRHGELAVETAMRMLMPTVAFLLMEVGMVSKEQFRQIWQRRRFVSVRPDQAVDRAVQDAKLDCPRTLQDCCRLVLSHHVGFRPGRQQRIEQLPLPRQLKHVVGLSDVCERVQVLTDRTPGHPYWF